MSQHICGLQKRILPTWIVLETNFGYIKKKTKFDIVTVWIVVEK